MANSLGIYVYISVLLWVARYPESAFYQFALIRPIAFHARGIMIIAAGVLIILCLLPLTCWDNTCRQRVMFFGSTALIATGAIPLLLTSIGSLILTYRLKRLFPDRSCGAIAEVRGAIRNVSRSPVRSASILSLAIFTALLATNVVAVGLYFSKNIFTMPFFRQLVGPAPDWLIVVTVSLALAVLIGKVGALLARWAIGFYRPDAATVISAAKDSIVLFLRPFGTKSVRRMERSCHTAFSYRGAFVAIGEPTELVPQLGALRTYATNDRWQDLIRDLVQLAEVIVLVAGTTPGVRWEMQPIRASGKVGQTIVLFPPSTSGERAAVQDALSSNLGIVVRCNEYKNEIPILAFYNLDGVAHVITARKATLANYELAIYMALVRLRAA